MQAWSALVGHGGRLRLSRGQPDACLVDPQEKKRERRPIFLFFGPPPRYRTPPLGPVSAVLPVDIAPGDARWPLGGLCRADGALRYDHRRAAGTCLGVGCGRHRHRFHALSKGQCRHRVRPGRRPLDARHRAARRPLPRGRAPGRMPPRLSPLWHGHHRRARVDHRLRLRRICRGHYSRHVLCYLGLRRRRREPLGHDLQCPTRQFQPHISQNLARPARRRAREWHGAHRGTRRC